VNQIEMDQAQNFFLHDQWISLDSMFNSEPV